MKVTKKVRLLARPATRVIAIRDMSVNSLDQVVDMTVENFDGVKGYYVVGPDTVVRIDGKVLYPDGAERNWTSTATPKPEDSTPISTGSIITPVSARR